MKQAQLLGFLLVLLLGFNDLFSQTVQVSNAVKLNNKVSKFKILGKVEDKYLVQRYGSEYHIVDVYNRSLKLVTSKQIQLEKNEFLEKIWIQATGSFLIKVRNDKEMNYIEVSKMDNKLNIAQKVTVVDSVYERKDLFQNNLRTCLSSNESKIMFYAPIFSQGKLSYFYTKVFNNNMQVINQLNIKSELLLNHDFVEVFLLNDGSYLFISKTDEKVENAQYFFTKVDVNGRISSSSFQSVMTIFKKPKFEVDEKNNALIIAGYFKEEDDNRKNQNGASQFFTTKLSLDNFQNIFTSFEPISQAFYFELTGKNSETDPPQLFTFYVKSIVPKMDGGCIVIAESYFKNEETNLGSSYFSVSGMSNYTTTTIYNFNDVLIYDVDSLGKLISQQIIRKKQVSQNDGGSYSSFYLMNMQDQLGLIYLDDIDNDAQLSLSKIKEDQERPRTYSLLNTASRNVVPIVNMSFQTTPNEILIPSFAKNKLQIIKILY